MRHIWYLSVRNYNTSRKFKIIGEEGEPAVDVYKKAKEIRDNVRKKYEGQAVTVELISGTKAFKPPVGYSNPRGHMWCPYCCKPRIFIFNSYRGVSKCSICTISDSDFSVKLFNDVFKKEFADWARQKEVKK